MLIKKNSKNIVKLNDRIKEAVSLEKKYQELIKNRIYFGGANDVTEMMENEKADVVFDLRVKEYDVDSNINRVHTPIVDEQEHQAESLKNALHQVKDAYENNKKVYFHCGGGNTRAGTVAIGTLLALGQAQTIEEAEEMVRSIRPTIKFKPEMKSSLKEIFPES